MKLIANPGQVLTHWHMPYLAAGKLIEHATGAPCHHCAVVLGGGIVWEAWMPKVRAVPWPGYQKQIDDWGTSWKYKLSSHRLIVKAWESPRITATDVRLMEAEAMRWLGHRYSMVCNYLRSGKGIHCSEFVARLLMAADLAEWLKEPSRITPISIEEQLFFNGWRIAGEIHTRELIR